MPRVKVREAELELDVDQIVEIVRQLPPDEREIVRRAVQPLPWEKRLEALLARVWRRVDHFPLTEEEIDAEVERARSAIYAESRR